MPPHLRLVSLLSLLGVAPLARTQNVFHCQENRCVGRQHVDFPINYGCSCNEQCVKFGNCCRDAPGAAAVYQDTCVELMDEPRFGTGDTYQQCASPRGMLPNSVYMVTQCPTSWSHDATRQACQSRNTSLYEDPLAALPVTSPRSGLTYQNAACARCHQDTVDVVIWNMTVECPEVSRWDRKVQKTLVRSESGFLGVKTVTDGVETFATCNIYPKEPKVLAVVHCLPTVTDCAPDWPDPETAAECGAYTAPVRDTSEMNDRAREYDHVYRNPHCALCNGIPLDSLRCGDLRNISTAPGAMIVCRLPGFSMLFDPICRSDSGIASVVDECDSSGTRRWDCISKKCRDLFCHAGDVLEGDKCVPETASSGNSSADSSSFRLCPKFYLSADEFETRSDGSVYVRLYERLYIDGEFELRDGKLVVCSDKDLQKFDDKLGVLSLVLVTASVICLCWHLVLFCREPEQRNLPGKNLAALCTCLLLGYICFMAAQFQEAGTGGCRLLGIVMYASFIASFLWMNVMAFDVFSSLIRAMNMLHVTSSTHLKPFLCYFLYTFIVTAVLVTAAIITDMSEGAAGTYRPGFGDRVCWFSRRKALMVFFAAPLLVIMTANMLMFIGSGLIISRAKESAVRNTCRPSKRNLKLYSRLAVISGLSWVFGLAAGWLDFPPLWHMFIWFNTLQGVFIFVFFTIGRRAGSRARRQMSLWLGRRQAGAGRGRSQTAGTSDWGPPTSETEM